MWVLPIDAGGASLQVAGGKGASLALLAAQGFPKSRLSVEAAAQAEARGRTLDLESIAAWFRLVRVRSKRAKNSPGNLPGPFLSGN